MIGRRKSASSSRPRVKSLRRILVFYLLAAALLPLIVVGVTAYYSIYSILSGKIASGINAGLEQQAYRLENAFDNLDYASKQFALDGQIVEEMSSFLQERQIYRKAQLMTSINEKINLVNFTNPYIGLTAYLAPESADPVLVTSLSARRDFDFEKLPRFMHYSGADYYGPHPTMYSVGDNLVLSERRAVKVSGYPVYIYLETNYSLLRRVFDQDSYGMKMQHMLVSQDGGHVHVIEGELPERVTQAAALPSTSSHDEVEGYHLFRYTSPQGWQLVAVVKKTVFNREIYDWVVKVVVLALFTLLFAASLGILVWRRMYAPLRKLNQEINRMAENVTAPVTFTQVEEFDHVLNNFQQMKEQVNELIQAVARNEKQKSQFEVEKLLSQINPHFLHNTLNTVQWLARLNGQKDIDRLVTLLVKVLHYNLGKNSLIVTIEEEMEAIRNYMELQRIRYDYEFDFRVEADEDVLSAAVPRFLLQPLVENSIYHGISDNGWVEVRITQDGESRILLRVSDNGAGMTEEEIAKLLAGKSEEKKGLGIGFSYVSRMLHTYFGSEMKLDIVSKPEEGTTVSILIPRKRKEDLDDTSGSRG
ncbi:sensor histidine kinase [Gorillibacterium sp. CAU 1737]|uniref:sensor histidine kinase n=1 Tax=Gorillibacterium sp. CAU 1737 TaxID=3140362 RepID=UPI0032607C9D